MKQVDLEEQEQMCCVQTALDLTANNVDRASSVLPHAIVYEFNGLNKEVSIGFFTFLMGHGFGLLLGLLFNVISLVGLLFLRRFQKQQEHCVIDLNRSPKKTFQLEVDAVVGTSIG